MLPIPVSHLIVYIYIISKTKAKQMKNRNGMQELAIGKPRLKSNLSCL